MFDSFMDNGFITTLRGEKLYPYVLV